MCEIQCRAQTSSLLLLGAGPSSSSSSSSSSSGSFHTATPALSSPSPSIGAASELSPGDRLGALSRGMDGLMTGASASSSSGSSSGQSGLPTGGGTSVGGGTSALGPSTREAPAADSGFVGWVDESPRFRPPTRKGLVNASTRDLTLVAPRPFTPERTLLGCLEILAKD